MRYALTFLLTSIAVGAAARADAYSGFTKDPGQLYVKLAVSTFTSNDFYDLSGRLNDRGQDFTQRSLGLYAEYGIVEGLTASANVPVVRMNAYANTDSAVGLGDVELSLKYGFRVAGFHLSASVSPELPLGDSDATVTTESGLNLVLPTGDGEFNVWTRLAVSRPFGVVAWMDGWASAGIGYNLRTEGFADQIGYGGELGFRLFERAYLQFRVRGQTVPSNDLDTNRGFIYGEGTEFFAVGAGAAVGIPETPLLVTFDWEQPVAAQMNLYSGAVLIAGIALAAG